MRYALMLSLLVLASCDGSSTGPVECGTFEAEPAIEVIVADAQSGLLLRGVPVFVTVTDGDFRLTESELGPVVGAAFARPGTYDVEVKVEGYVAWTSGRHTVISNGCQPITKTLLAELQPLP